ncbi:MAG TPA: hypothetical protein VK549_08355 [Acidimicrobiia bacterium]|nr:hypothetical protein [Acidimicrobiia bacterium]
MITWPTILYGAALSALITAAALAIPVRTRRPTILVPAVVAAAIGPVAWNAILRATHADEFFTDAPISVFPASWQDTGSGVFAFAALLLGIIRPHDQARTIIAVAATTGTIAFLVDVYLY